MLRLSIAKEFEEVVLTARLAFSKRSWPFVLAALIPWLLCTGQRSMTRLAALGRHPRSLSSYYRFLSDGKWRLECLFRSLFELIVAKFHLCELTLVLDDTLCPKWGRGIFGTANYFDHTARPVAGYIWGHNWVVLAIVVSVGKVGWVAMPFWIALYRPEKDCRASDFRTRHEMAVERLASVRAWFSGPIQLLADGAYANRSLVGPLQALSIHVVSRMRSDARLREPTPPVRRRRRGRRPQRGRWHPRLSQWAARARSWQLMPVAIYGRSVQLLVAELVAYWPPLRRSIKVVVTRDPHNRRRIAYLWTTDVQMDCQAVIELFARRWSIEQLFSVAKLQLGLDSAEVRKERSVIRHAALGMALVTWVEVWKLSFRPHAHATSFAAKLALLRAHTITQTIFTSGPRSEAARRIANDLGHVLSVATKAA